MLVRSDMGLNAICARLSFLLCLTTASLAYKYETRSFQVPVDHFSFANNETFNIRYLINDTFWRKTNGPIFFYTGNEGDIELFSENTGFIWESAPEFKALIVFAEHRYYGRSLPYGNKSFTEPRYSGYLTSQQALADYVDLITNLTSRQEPGRKSPVIAFGGSYGGMLAAYLRIKYPHIVQGAIAASAPIWQFTGMTPCEAFNRIVTSVYKMENETCPQIIRQSWAAIDHTTANDTGKAWLSKAWSLCRPLKKQTDVQTLKSWLNDAYTNLAMANYPYPANFLANLPGYPIREFCSRLQAPLSPSEALLTGLYRGINLYINYTGQSHCFDFDNGSPGLDDRGWAFQSCTEMVMPICSNGVTDMFEKLEWDFEKTREGCLSEFKTKPDPYLVEKTYGGKNIAAASNIIFSNGLLDPWSSGGVLKDLSKSLIAVLIPEGAHHLDLRAAHPDDPKSVQKARILYRRFIGKWSASDPGFSPTVHHT